MRALQYTDKIPKSFYIPKSLESKEYDTHINFNYNTEIDDGVITINTSQGTQYIDGDNRDVLLIQINIYPNNSSVGYTNAGESQTLRYINEDGYSLFDVIQNWRYDHEVATFESSYDEKVLITLSDEFYEVHKNDDISSTPFSTNLLYTDKSAPEPEPEPDPEPEPIVERNIMKMHKLANEILGINEDKVYNSFYKLLIINKSNYIVELKDSEDKIVNPSKESRDNKMEYRLDAGTYIFRSYKLDEDGNKEKKYFEEIYVPSEDNDMENRIRTILI